MTSGGCSDVQVHHLETRRCVAQQPVRPRHVPRRQHEVVRAVRQGVDQLANDMTKARKALERPEFERFIEQEGARLAAGRARGIEKRQQRVECFTRARRHGVDAVPAEWRSRCDGGQESLGRRGAALHVDVLGRAASDPFPETQEQGRPTGSTSPQDDWNP